ncbi:MAG: glycosyltransferase family 2 protein [Calditrichaeota bacterium]|nr:MAG: glycosyltransferase family 2 protein [Calditrichota bacterium]
MKKSVAIIILNWNAADDTIACIQQISRWQHLRPVIWVVDNASTDDSVERIRRSCPDVYLICSSTNLGFAGGSNRGIQAAIQSGFSAILLLNNDAYISEENVISLLETLDRHERIGFVGPLLYDSDQRSRLISAGGKNPVLHHQTRVKTPSTTTPYQPVEAISGTVVLIRGEIFRKVGFLDESYFFSTELADLCKRGQLAGYQCIIDCRAKAYHSIKRSAKFRDTLYIYYIVRNRFIYIRKFYGTISGFLLFFFWTLDGIVLSLKLILTKKSSSARAVWLGLIDGLRGRFGGQNERVLRYCLKTVEHSPNL